jgi:excinuclease ABC subunit B
MVGKDTPPSSIFDLTSDFKPAGDQPQAIQELISGAQDGECNQVLLGITGSGKTFTIAHVIQDLGRPALILAPNKTLAAQLYAEMKAFFPKSAVEYFVSYYDYYQPEAFVPRTNTYIEKEATINEQIDRMRHSATRALLERRDVVVVASVSCIYGIGSVESYAQMVLSFKVGQTLDFKKTLLDLAHLQYTRGDHYLTRGTFRKKGDILEIFPAHYEDRAWRLSLFDDEIESIVEIDPLTGKTCRTLEEIALYPNSHYVTPGPTLAQAVVQIKKDLKVRLEELLSQGKLVEEQRLRERTTFDLEMMATTGTCAGIENYSRYLTGRAPGEPPPTLFEYLPKDALLVVDESHVAIPQLHGMYRGDAARKTTLAEHGFRLPSCADNRPLKFEEWNKMRPQTIFVSATPGPWELEQTHGAFIEQIIRPTGLMDPLCTVYPTEGQVDHLIGQCRQVIEEGGRVLITTLTKKMAESLQEYFDELHLKARYIHSDVDTLERIEIIQDLRRGTFDVLIGINLLREGLDIPECTLVAIMDADKEGFLRSRTSLIQTMGRAARNVAGRVILYADTITRSMQEAMDETHRRREKQEVYNKKHHITPASIKKNLTDILGSVYSKDYATSKRSSRAASHTFKSQKDKEKHIKALEKAMLEAADNLDFEEAARLRDEMHAQQQDMI